MFDKFLSGLLKVPDSAIETVSYKGSLKSKWIPHIIILIVTIIFDRFLSGLLKVTDSGKPLPRHACPRAHILSTHWDRDPAGSLWTKSKRIHQFFVDYCWHPDNILRQSSSWTKSTKNTHCQVPNTQCTHKVQNTLRQHLDQILGGPPSISCQHPKTKGRNRQWSKSILQGPLLLIHTDYSILMIKPRRV